MQAEGELAPAAASPSTGGSAARQFGRAWLLHAVALALHVTDEASTDFLSVYNPLALAIRQRLPWLPVPVFSFGVWLAGLAAAIALLLALTPLAQRGARGLVIVALPLSVLMVFNGLGHIGGSFYFGRFMPGVYSSPVLIAAAGWLLISALRIFKLKNPQA